MSSLPLAPMSGVCPGVCPGVIRADGRRRDVGAFYEPEQGDESCRAGRNPIARTGTYLQALARFCRPAAAVELAGILRYTGRSRLKGARHGRAACAGPGPASILAVAEKSRSDVHHV